MDRCELYAYEHELWINRDGVQEKVEEGSPFVEEMFHNLEENYPEAMNALQEYYNGASRNISYFRYLIVRRFCKCNFSILDNVLDIDCNGEFHFEHVPCPLRGECKFENIICHPVFNSQISNAEKRVLELVYKGYKEEDIANALFLSVFTVKNHIKNAYRRIGVHSKAEFMQYANQHNVFDVKDKTK